MNNDKKRNIKAKRGNYLGVHTLKSGRFLAQVIINGEQTTLGVYSKEEAAACAYNDFLIKNNCSVGLNEIDYVEHEKYKVDLSMPIYKPRAKSGFKGVYANKKRWAVKFKNENLGTYDTKEEAARVYNIRAFSEYGENAVLNGIPDPLGSGF